MAMRRARCAFDTAAALRRIFIPPIEHPPLHLPLQAHISSTPYLHLNSRHGDRSYASAAQTKHRQPRDEEIEYSTIRIVSADSKLSPPTPLLQTLASLDRKTDTIIMVDAVPATVDEASGIEQTPAYAIVKIQSKKTLQQAEKARSKKKKEAASASATLKTIELNWAIDPHDLKHRLDRVREFLGKGWRVDVIMANKLKGRKASLEEAEVLLGRVRGVMGEVEGAKEWKKMDGQVGGTATIYVEGKQA